MIDRQSFHYSFVSLISGFIKTYMIKINHSNARNLNREAKDQNSLVKQSRPYFVLVFVLTCFNPFKFMALEGSIAGKVNEILLGNRKSIAATILK